MSKFLISLGLAASALLGLPATSLPQNAVSQYPWCWEYGIGGPQSCYYATWDQCHVEMVTRGGFCVQSPYYHPPGASAPRASVPARHHRHVQKS
jgi:hypothetical protein